MISSTSNAPFPVAIGGVGGSGTRVVARTLAELGFYLGDDLNKADDTLTYTFLFVRPDLPGQAASEFEARQALFFRAMTGGGAVTAAGRDLIVRLAAQLVPHGPMADSEWLRERANRLIAAVERPNAANGPWGWKEPNTHIFLNRFVELVPQMRYIHVVRNGLDMAFSRNQHQSKLWGRVLFGLDGGIDPRASLKYWCHAHRRVLRIGETMGQNFLFLSFDELCRNPAPLLTRLCDFLGIHADEAATDRLSRHVLPPASVGRFKKHDLSVFDENDIAYVASLGFDVT